MLEVAAGVRVVGLVEELMVVQLVPEQRARQHELFAAHHDDLLAAQQLVRNDGGESAYQVSSSVYDNLLFEHT